MPFLGAGQGGAERGRLAHWLEPGIVPEEGHVGVAVLDRVDEHGQPSLHVAGMHAAAGDHAYALGIAEIHHAIAGAARLLGIPTDGGFHHLHPWLEPGAPLASLEGGDAHESLLLAAQHGEHARHVELERGVRFLQRSLVQSESVERVEVRGEDAGLETPGSLVGGRRLLEHADVAEGGHHAAPSLRIVGIALHHAHEAIDRLFDPAAVEGESCALDVRARHLGMEIERAA